MRSVLALASGIALALAAAVPSSYDVEVLQERQAVSSDDCSSLHIIVARGSYEAAGEGYIGAVASDVCALV